jgi:hypothetical protein
MPTIAIGTLGFTGPSTKAGKGRTGDRRVCLKGPAAVTTKAWLIPSSNSTTMTASAQGLIRSHREGVSEVGLHPSSLSSPLMS